MLVRFERSGRARRTDRSSWPRRAETPLRLYDQPTMNSPVQKHRVVIVGGGAGGLELAMRLGDTLGKRGVADIVVDKHRTPSVEAQAARNRLADASRLCCMRIANRPTEVARL